MWQSFILLFSQMQPLVYILFILGIVLCVIELFIPGFGLFGITGIILTILGIIIRMINGGDVFMLLYMVVIASAIIGGMFLIISTSARKGALSRSKIFDVGTSVPTGKTEGTKDFSFLIGSVGVSKTLLRPIGEGKFCDQIFDVMAKNATIEAGKNIKVVYVEGQKILVEEVEE